MPSARGFYTKNNVLHEDGQVGGEIEHARSTCPSGSRTKVQEEKGLNESESQTSVRTKVRVDEKNKMCLILPDLMRNVVKHICD